MADDLTIPYVRLPESLFKELLEWFDKFQQSPVIHHQQLPARLIGCARHGEECVSPKECGYSSERETADAELARHLDSEHHAIRATEIDSPMNACSLKETCQRLKRLALNNALVAQSLEQRESSPQVEGLRSSERTEQPSDKRGEPVNVVIANLSDEAADDESVIRLCNKARQLERELTNSEIGRQGLMAELGEAKRENNALRDRVPSSATRVSGNELSELNAALHAQCLNTGLLTTEQWNSEIAHRLSAVGVALDRAREIAIDECLSVLKRVPGTALPSTCVDRVLALKARTDREGQR